ncbi:MAG: permease, partial [Patescibacteria group bacterium]
DAVNFFIYDSLKILILLLIINYLMAILRHYLPIEKLRDFLVSKKWYGFDYFLAAIFGTITPFCSCSSIPLFIGFLEAGIPLGVTLSFLIVSPLVNQVAIVLFAGLFGWKITIFYVVSAILLGVVGGFILSKLKLEKYVADYVWKIKSNKIEIKKEKLSYKNLLIRFWQEGFSLTKKITPYVLIGIAVGAAIHGFVPAGFFEKYITAENFLAVPIATIVAVPMYANSVGVIPIMQSLVEKGIPLGTAMAFMMAVVGLSLPEALILKRVMKMKLLLLFFGVTTINIIVIGYLFNFLIK